MARVEVPIDGRRTGGIRPRPARHHGAASAAGLSAPCSRFDASVGSPTIRVEQSSRIPTSRRCSIITIDISWCFACAWPTIMRQPPEFTIETSLKRAIDSRVRQFASVRDAERAALSGTLVAGLDRHREWSALCDSVTAEVRRHGYVVIRGLEVDEGRSLLIISSTLGTNFDTYGPRHIVKRFRMSPLDDRALPHYPGR